MKRARSDIGAAERRVAQLNAQAAGLRNELARLGRELAREQHGLEPARTSQLVEANEHLVLALLHERALAQTAGKTLNDLSSAGQRDEPAALLQRSPPHPADARSSLDSPGLAGSTALETDPHLQDLREANERLLISATDAQAREARADEAHRRQVKLQAVVVHELRNPLVPIRMAAELLKRAPNDDQMIAKLPGMIERQVSHMVRLIDDLLDSSRVNTGKFRLDYANVALNEVIATAVEIGKTAMDSRRQSLHVSVPASLPTIYGDAARLTQILSNLLDNASKYTPEGGDVALTVDWSNGSVAITVSDNGIGIAAEMLPKIFDLFVQDITGLVRHNSGLGIGLAVVRELVNAHGGSVSVESAGRNHGSKFVVTLPVS